MSDTQGQPIIMQLKEAQLVMEKKARRLIGVEFDLVVTARKGGVVDFDESKQATQRADQAVAILQCVTAVAKYHHAEITQNFWNPPCIDFREFGYAAGMVEEVTNILLRHITQSDEELFAISTEDMILIWGFNKLILLHDRFEL